MFDLNIDVATARRILLGIVDRFGPDHRATNPNPYANTTCTYAVQTMENGKYTGLAPVCLIGQMFADWGLLGLLVYGDPTDTTGSLGLLDACVPDGAVWSAAEAVGIKVSPDAQNYFRLAQGGQDSNLPWSNAIAYADAYFLWEKRQDARDAMGLSTEWGAPNVEDFQPSTPDVTETPLQDWERELLGDADDQPF